mgnify:FL=1
MARPTKKGVGYFPFDTDFFEDEKIRILKGQFGLKGIMILIALYCEIYKDGGYYKQFCDVQGVLLAERLGCEVSPKLISEVISGCCQCGLFDKAVFSASEKLTSRSIQRRFIRAVSKRDAVVVEQDCWLLDGDNPEDIPAAIRPRMVYLAQSGGKNGVSGGRNPEKDTENTIKKRKEKQKKTDIFVSFAEKFQNGAALLEALESFSQARKEMRKPLTARGEKQLCRKLQTMCEQQGIAKRDEAAYMIASLEESELRGWTGVFPVKDFMPSSADPPEHAAIEEPGTGLIVTDDSELAALL